MYQVHHNLAKPPYCADMTLMFCNIMESHTWKVVGVLLLLHYIDGQVLPASNHLYPYGPSAGDQVIQSDQTAVNLGMEINFSGKNYSTIYITKDGILAFDDTVHYQQFNFSAASQNLDSDHPFVAPLYYSGQSIASQNQGKIYYRMGGLDTIGSYSHMFKPYLLNSTVEVESFDPEMFLIVTWENVTDTAQIESGSCTGIAGSPCQTATFQILLIASAEETFFIVSYLKMDIPSQPYYQAGINSGHGMGWTSVCPGCSLSDLPAKRRSAAYGGYIFRVTKDIPERGGCGDGGEKLQISPTVAMMFGGKLLEISGPCPQPTKEIYCRFDAGTSIVITSGFTVNGITIKCPVPRLTKRGLVPVSVSVDDAKTFRGIGSIYIVMYGPIPRSINLVHGWYDLTPNNITMTWDTTALSLDEKVKVDIKLIGYRETKTQIIWKDLAILSSNTTNTGTFTFRPSDYQCVQEDCDLFEVGMVEVELQKSFYTKSQSRVTMNAGVLPLGWYMNNAMVEKHGINWPPKRCQEWYNKDKVDMAWMKQLLYCPCNVDQALADFGRWQPDVGCNMYSLNPRNCFYHKGAKHCVRSFHPSSSGSGNQCCYTQDGLLSYAADSYQGSTPDKSHDWGAYPYNKPGYVPSFSHWIEDVVTFYYCCLWTNYSHCDYYMEQRATRDCNGYRPSKAATAFGDPHIMTFDGKLYNFGGKGDFTLLKGKSFALQGKFKLGKQVHADQRQYNATVMTAVAMKTDTSNTVEIRLSAEALTSGRLLDVFVDGEFKPFNSKALAKQDLTGVSVINQGISVDASNTRQDNFTVLLQSGVGVQVAASNGLLHVVVNVPPDFYNHTSGLMGTWNDAVHDDFTARNALVVDATSKPEDVYQDFAKTWMVTQANSLFTYHNMADDNFVPVYSEPVIPPGTLTDITDVCKGNPQCRFDYIVTGDRDIGIASRMAYDWFAELKSFQRLASTCGLLDVPYSKKDNYNYTLGNTVSIIGCRNGGGVTGKTTYICAEEGDVLQWQPTVSAKCSVPAATEMPDAAGDAKPRRYIPSLVVASYLLSIAFPLLSI